MTDQPQNPNDPTGAVPPAVPPVPPPPPTQPGGYGQQPPAGGGFPPPPAGGYPPAASGGPGGPVNADVGAAFNWSFNRFGKYAAILIGLVAVVFAIRLVGALVNRVIVDALVGECTVVAGEDFTLTTSGCGATLVQTIIGGLITALIFGVLAWIATIGIYRAALKTTKGEAPVFAHLTSGENLGPYLIVAIVYGLAIGIGLVLCILPGIIVAFLFQLAPFYALDKGQGIGEAFGNSFRATTQNFGPAILMTIINIVAAFLGSLLFGVLTLVALPFAALFTAHMYRQFNREQVITA